ncbi:MAG: glycosyltransferase [Alphaproteobacteria bacterium]|nr:glycosyltransferase [Alphaproteobacteria bacterium]
MAEAGKERAPRILTVIVNYRTADLVAAHFNALVEERRELPGLSVAIVDNASPGEDFKKLQALAAREDLRDWVEVIASPKNGGFAFGNNLAIRPALRRPAPPDYVFLLNPDAYPRPGGLSTLVKFLERNPRLGIAGPRLEDADGTPQSSAFRFFSIAGEFETAARTGLISRLLSGARVAPPPSDRTERADWICGAAVLIRRNVFDAIGLFDEDYFLYFEETDFMLRAARAGWQTWIAPKARVVHLRGQSSGGDVPGLPANGPAPAYWYHSRAHYFRKNKGALYARAADAAWLAGALLYSARARLFGDGDAAYWAAVRRFAKSQFGGGLPAEPGRAR